MPVSTLFVELRAMAQKFQSDMNSAAKTVRKVGFQMQDVGRGLTAGLTLPIVGVGAASLKMATDAAESFSKFQTVFGPAADEMSGWITDLMDTVPATSQQLQDMTSGLQDLLVPLGVIPEDAIQMNKQFVQLAADLASFNNIPIDEALNAIRSGLVGSSEPLRRFGVDVRQLAVDAKAAELGLIGYGDRIVDLDPKMQGALRAQAVLAIALEQSTFAIGDASRTADQMANSVRFLWRDVEELGIKLGTSLLPIAQKVLNEFIRPFIESVGEWVDWFTKLDSQIQTIVVAIAAFAAAIGPLLVAVGFLLTNLAALGPLLAGIATFLTGPVGIAVAIGAVVTAFAAWWSTTETGSRVLGALWDIVKLVGEIVFNLARVIWENVKPAFDAIGTVIKLLVLPVIETMVVGLEDLLASLRMVGEFLGLVEKNYVAFSEEADVAKRATDDLTKAIDKEIKSTKGAADAAAKRLEAAVLSGEAIVDLGAVSEETQKKVKKLSEEMQTAFDAVEKLGEKYDLARKPLVLYRTEQEALSSVMSAWYSGLPSLKTEIDKATTSITNQRDKAWELKENIVALDTALWNAVGAAKAPFDKLVEGLDNTSIQLIGPDGKGGVAGDFQTLAGSSKAALESIGNQVSTIFTDFSKSIVDIIFEWDGMWESMKNAAIEMGKAILRSIVESLITPLINKLSGIASGWISGLIGGGSGGIFSAMSPSSAPGVLSPLGGGGSALGGIGSIAGMANPIGVVSGVVGAVAGVIGAFQQAKAADKLSAIDMKMAGVLSNSTGANLIGNEIIRIMWIFRDTIHNRMHPNLSEIRWNLLPDIRKRLDELVANSKAIRTLTEGVKGLASNTVTILSFLQAHTIALAGATAEFWSTQLSKLDNLAEILTIIKDNLVIQGSFAAGTSFVPHSGLYMLHGGEAVIPAGAMKMGGVAFDDVISGAGTFRDVMLDGIKDMVKAARGFQVETKRMSSSAYVQDVVIPEINRAVRTRQSKLVTRGGR